jgi:hypothetical protein
MLSCADLSLSPSCLQEDPSVTTKRAAVRDLWDRIKMAIDDVQYKQEKVKRKDHEGDNVSQASSIWPLWGFDRSPLPPRPPCAD